MPLIKLRRINKGGEIVLNSEHIVFIEIEGRSTTVHLSGGLLFSVEESPDDIMKTIGRANPAGECDSPGQPTA